MTPSIRKTLKITAHFIFISSFPKFIFLYMYIHIHSFLSQRIIDLEPLGLGSKQCNYVAFMELKFSWGEADNEVKAHRIYCPLYVFVQMYVYVCVSVRECNFFLFVVPDH